MHDRTGGPGTERRNLAVLLVALGIDNFGSGLFLPLTMVYLTRVVGVAVGQAGLLVGGAALFGLAVPALASRAVAGFGPRLLVAVSQLAQAVGMVALLVAHGPVSAAVGVLLAGAGLQLFYSCLTALVVDVVGDSPKDHPFSLVTRVRGASFGTGALTGGVLASLRDPVWMRVGVAANIVTFLVAAGIVWAGVGTIAHRRGAEGTRADPVSVLSARPFLGLMVIAFCTTLPVDFFLGGYAVYVTDYLGVDAWLVGFSVALLTAVSSILGSAAVRLTNRFSRVATEAVGIGFFLAWTALSAACLLVPSTARTVSVAALAVVIALANVIPMARLSAMAEATAPAEQKAQFLAVFQYPYSIAQVVGPTLTSLLAIAAWLPWAVVAVVLLVALLVLAWLRNVLPRRAVHVQGSTGLAPYSGRR